MPCDRRKPLKFANQAVMYAPLRSGPHEIHAQPIFLLRSKSETFSTTMQRVSCDLTDRAIPGPASFKTDQENEIQHLYLVQEADQCWK